MRPPPYAAFLCLLVACADDQGANARSHAAYKAPAPTQLTCVPNLDGSIEASELSATVGVPVSYLVSAPGETRPVDLKGAAQADGSLRWDFGADFASDKVATIVAASLGDQWYAAAFPGGAFTTPFDAGHTLDAVYSHTSEALFLHGLASTQESPAEGKTLLVYTQPVALYRFPIQPGGSWVSEGEIVNATVRGLPYAGMDTYETTDDAIGTLVLADLTFTQAHRVRTRVTNHPAAGQTLETRQVSFLFECFGEVARATSKPGEQAVDFGTAAELRRLGL